MYVSVLVTPLISELRLVQDTTGTLILARNPRIVKEIHKQLSLLQATKEYYAVVRPGPRLLGSMKGEINDPLFIDDHGAVRLASILDPEGGKVKSAKTRWELVVESVSISSYKDLMLFLMRLLAESSFRFSPTEARDGIQASAPCSPSIGFGL